jgi:hypothetical protein
MEPKGGNRRTARAIDKAIPIFTIAWQTSKKDRVLKHDPRQTFPYQGSFRNEQYKRQLQIDV